jgi:hypothetical protein
VLATRWEADDRKDTTLTGWTVLLRGMRHRTGRSLVVLVLAATAVTAAVLIPAYAQVAQQSVLTDTLRAAPPFATSVTVAASGGPDSPAYLPALESNLVSDRAISGKPLLKSLVGKPVTTVETEGSIPGGNPLKVRYVFRGGVCQLLTVTGECPSDAGQLLVSGRAAKAHGFQIGRRLTVLVGGKPQVREIVGTYVPKDATASVWGTHAYFGEGALPDESGVARSDALFAGSEEDLKAVPAAQVDLAIVYPVAVDRVRRRDVAQLSDDLDAVGVRLAGNDLQTTTALPTLLREVDADQAAIARTVPVVAVPLLLLVVAVLMLLVASLAEERGPEIALAKLRGYPAARSARFGLGEVLLLITLGTPIGLAAGLAVTEAAARTVLAPGVHVELVWQPFAAAAAALLVAFLAAWAASRRTVRSGVLSLLRRVPHRGGWRAGAGEGMAAALAAAAVVAAWRDRSSPLALLAAPLLAIVAGIAIGRLLGVTAGVRLALARHSGNVATMLAAAQLARRPGRHRVVTVVTVAVALLGFAATAWDVAAQAREVQAQEALGAQRVYSVSAIDPQVLIDAVRQAAPDGSAMPVLRMSKKYAGEMVEVVAVPSAQLSKVAVWPGHSAEDLAELGTRLHPPAAPPVATSGLLSVRATAAQLGTSPLRLTAIVAMPGSPPKFVPLGTLQKGTHEYAATVPTGRFAGLMLMRLSADSGTASARLEIHAIRVGGQSVPLDDQATWRGEQRSGEGGVTVQAGPALKVDVEASGNADIILSYLDSPASLPVALAGEAPDDDRGAREFSFMGLADDPQRFAVVRHAPALPRAGAHGFLVDLDYALRRADATVGQSDNTQFAAEVWVGSGAPEDLAQRLSAAGLSVTQVQTLDELRGQLSRRAPALAWRLYLLAGIVAAALALGVVLLVARLGANVRRHEFAALRVTGVPARTLRRGVRREYLALLGLPVATGFAVGVGSAWLMLPGMPLVTVDRVSPLSWTPQVGALAAAAAAGLLCLLLAIFVAARLVRRAAPELLRGDV